MRMTENLISSSRKQCSVPAVLPPQWLSIESAFKGVNQLISFVCKVRVGVTAIGVKKYQTHSICHLSYLPS